MAAIIYKESLPTNNMKDGNTNIKMSNRHYTKLPISHSELPFYSFVCIAMAGRISVSRILGNHTPMRRIPVWLLKVKEKQKSLLILKLYWAGWSVQSNAHLRFGQELLGVLYFIDASGSCTHCVSWYSCPCRFPESK